MKYLLKIGIAIIVIGFLYDAIFVGMPYQDPPKEVLVTLERNAIISKTIIKIGLAIVLISIAGKIASQKNNPEQQASKENS